MYGDNSKLKYEARDDDQGAFLAVILSPLNTTF